MKTRIILLSALLAVGCSTKNKNSAIIVTKIIAGTVSGTPPNLVCTFDPSAKETDFIRVDPSLGSGLMGVVISNQMVNPATNPLSGNSVLRTDSTTFNQHQVVAQYQVLRTSTTVDDVIAVSGLSINASGTAPVLTPFFNPASVRTLSGTIRVTFHVEGRLDDGSTVKSTEHEYIFLTCTGLNCGGPCT
jgi:hypothetical protein